MTSKIHRLPAQIAAGVGAAIAAMPKAPLVEPPVVNIEAAPLPVHAAEHGLKDLFTGLSFPSTKVRGDWTQFNHNVKIG
jgi:hypothetical protein